MSNVTNATNNNTSANLTVVIMSNVVTVLVMFGITSSVTMTSLKSTIAFHPSLFLVGLISQTIFLPLCSYLLILAFNIQRVHALVLLVLACCPGGTSSNIFAYWSGSDVPLSIALTALTNSCAFFTMPLLLYLWGEQALALPFVVIPYAEIALSLGIVLIPAISGLWLKKNYEKCAHRVEKIGGIAGLILIILAIVVSMVANWEEMGKQQLMTWNIYVVIILLAPCGMIFAMVLLCVRNCFCYRYNKLMDEEQEQDEDEIIIIKEEGIAQWTTVCLETGIQNVPLALSVASLTVLRSGGSSADMLSVGLLAGLWSIVVNLEALILTLVCRWYHIYRRNKETCQSKKEKDSQEIHVSACRDVNVYL